MSEFKLTTPVAFIIFNRPDTTERVFAEIAKAKPTKLLVIADGPRSGRQGEAEKCNKTRSIIDKVDWDCEVLTNFSEVNLGCKVRVSNGIDWIFQQVEEAIILEDDCLPDHSFFRFCQEMLDRYRSDKRVGMISGDNFQFGRNNNEDSYYFSKYMHIWGWATWRDRWQGIYDVDMKMWPALLRNNQEDRLFVGLYGAKKWIDIFDRVYNNKIDTWDYQWVFANWLNDRLSIVPSKNLISNIGFSRADATHTVGGGVEANLPTQSILFPLKHPSVVAVNVDFDTFEYNKLLKNSIFRRVFYKLFRFFN